MSANALPLQAPGDAKGHWRLGQRVHGALKLGALVVVFLIAFTVGSMVVPQGTLPAMSADDARSATQAMLWVAIVDVAILSAIAAGSTLWGWRLWAFLAGLQWFLMTVTSQLESLWFMPNVNVGMAPWLLTMTLPVSVLFPAAWITAFRRWHRPTELPLPAEKGHRGRAIAWRVALLGAVVYPVLFFAAGYFIAWQSPEVRSFYTGSTALAGPLEHFTGLFRNDPWLYPFEALRGLLWVLAALAVLRTTRWPWWAATLLVALAFCFVQNDLHWIPNPLMPAEVSRIHFIETGTSNFLFALVIGWVLRPTPGSAAGADRLTAGVGVLAEGGVDRVR